MKAEKLKIYKKHFSSQTNFTTNMMNTLLHSHLHYSYTYIFIPSDAMFSDTPFQYLLLVYQFRMTWPLLHIDVMVIHAP